MTNQRAKGRRNENKAKKRLKSIGFNIDSQNYSRYGSKDLFNLFDIVAVHPETPTVWVQVKTNVAKGINSFSKEVRNLLSLNHNKVFYFVWHDYEGFRVIQINDEGRETVVDERKEDSISSETFFENFINKHCG